MAVAEAAKPQPAPRPRMVAASQGFLQCVPYARGLSGIQIRGDAHTWWAKAAGRYARGRQPRVGAVIVLKTGRNRGHIATVTGILDERTVIAEHANWLNRGKIHLETPIRDVSRAGDWSSVRVWYTPGGVWGRSAYAVEGFIYPETLTASSRD